MDAIDKQILRIIQPEKLGLGTTIFVFIEVGAHSSKELARFIRDIVAMEEVVAMCPSFATWFPAFPK